MWIPGQKGSSATGRSKNTTPPGSPTASGWTGSLVLLKDLSIPNKKVETGSPEQRARLMKAFGYTYEDLMTAILPMARDGAEQTASMGIDIPLAVLSEHEQPLFNYFKQLFAQVTNPPSTPFAKRSLPTPPYTWATTATCLPIPPKTAGSSRSTTPF